jgi:hypothetical protein
MNRDPVVVCTYGPSGVGKTTDQGYSFPRALFIAAPGALTSLQHVCGYIPASTYVKTLEEATGIVRQAAKQGFTAVVVDDFSFMAEQTFASLEARKFTGFKLWGTLRDQALEFRDAARFAGVDVILNCWEQAPKAIATGGKVRGGPMLSGRLPEKIPAMCDVVLRASHEPKRKPWPGVYRCSSDPNYVMKDRFNVAPVVDPAPMNLAELLRAANIEIDRHPELPQQEEVVEHFANEMLASTANPLVKANEFYTFLLGEGWAVPAVRWTLRDALDRYTIRKARADAQSSFIDTTGMIL